MPQVGVLLDPSDLGPNPVELKAIVDLILKLVFMQESERESGPTIDDIAGGHLP